MESGRGWGRGWLSERVGDYPGRLGGKGQGGKGQSVKRWGPGEAERKERIWERAEGAVICWKDQALEWTESGGLIALC